VRTLYYKRKVEWRENLEGGVKKVKKNAKKKRRKPDLRSTYVPSKWESLTANQQTHMGDLWIVDRWKNS